MVTNPNCEFHYIAVDGNLLGLIIHPDRALHVLVELILGKPQEYARNDAISLKRRQATAMNCTLRVTLIFPRWIRLS